MASSDALDIPKRPRTVVSGADEDHVGLAENLPLGGIKSPIEEILDHAGHVPEVLRRADGQPLAIQEVLEGGIAGLFEDDLRTFYARGQTGQQLLLGAYQQLARQIGLGNVTLHNRVELVDVVTVDGRCAGIVTRDLVNGEFRSHAGHATVLCTGGYGNVFFLSTNAKGCNASAIWR